MGDSWVQFLYHTNLLLWTAFIWEGKTIILGNCWCKFPKETWLPVANWLNFLGDHVLLGKIGQVLEGPCVSQRKHAQVPCETWLSKANGLKFEKNHEFLGAKWVQVP
jgi:hypothetical protein